MKVTITTENDLPLHLAEDRKQHIAYSLSICDTAPFDQELDFLIDAFKKFLYASGYTEDTIKSAFNEEE